MTPSATARAWMLAHPEHGTFDDALLFHMEHGYVWNSPRSFVLATIIRSVDWPGTFIPQADGDTWFIWLAAGDWGEFFEVCPERKEFVCFVRRGFPRFYSFDRIQRLCTSHPLPPHSASHGPSKASHR